MCKGGEATRENTGGAVGDLVVADIEAGECLQSISEYLQP